MPLGPDAERAFAEAPRVAALHMIHVRASRDIERRMRGDLLRSLLEGRGSPDSIIARIGIDPRMPLTVIAFELQTNDPAQEDLHRERLVDLVTLYCEAFRRRAACVSVGRTVYALVPVPESITKESHSQSRCGDRRTRRGDARRPAGGDDWLDGHVGATGPDRSSRSRSCAAGARRRSGGAQGGYERRSR